MFVRTSVTVRIAIYSATLIYFSPVATCFYVLYFMHFQWAIMWRWFVQLFHSFWFILSARNE